MQIKIDSLENKRQDLLIKLQYFSQEGHDESGFEIPKETFTIQSLQMELVSVKGENESLIADCQKMQDEVFEYRQKYEEVKANQ